MCVAYSSFRTARVVVMVFWKSSKLSQARNGRAQYKSRHPQEVWRAVEMQRSMRYGRSDVRELGGQSSLPPERASSCYLWQVTR